MTKTFLKLVHDRPFPHLFPNLNCQNVSVHPFALLLILHFTSPSIFPYLSFIFYVVCYIFKAYKNIWTDRRTVARFWLTFTSQNNTLDNKLPRTSVSNPRHVSNM
jgi:hypothetical protein